MSAGATRQVGKPDEEEEGSRVLPGGGWTGPATAWPTGPGSGRAWLGKTCGELAGPPGRRESRFRSADARQALPALCRAPRGAVS